MLQVPLAALSTDIGKIMTSEMLQKLGIDQFAVVTSLSRRRGSGIPPCFGLSPLLDDLTKNQ